MLKQEGLFRKSGNHTQIQDMKQRIDKGNDHYTHPHPPLRRLLCPSAALSPDAEPVSCAVCRVRRLCVSCV